MSDERLKFIGRRQELELERKNLQLKAEALVNGMREELNPLKPCCDLRTDLIVTLGIDLADVCDRFKETAADLKKIQDLLGR